MPLEFYHESFRQITSGSVELLAHVDAALTFLHVHLDLLQESRRYSCQCILWPRLQKYNSTVTETQMTQYTREICYFVSLLIIMVTTQSL